MGLISMAARSLQKPRLLLSVTSSGARWVEVAMCCITAIPCQMPSTVDVATLFQDLAGRATIFAGGAVRPCLVECHRTRVAAFQATPAVVMAAEAPSTVEVPLWVLP